jgi:hypothetical protein
LLSLCKVLHADEVPKSETPDTEEDKERFANIYAEKAKNLAVVDMRDGYIFKIAPVRIRVCCTMVSWCVDLTPFFLPECLATP